MRRTARFGRWTSPRVRIGGLASSTTSTSNAAVASWRARWSRQRAIASGRLVGGDDDGEGGRRRVVHRASRAAAATRRRFSPARGRFARAAALGRGRRRQRRRDRPLRAPATCASAAAQRPADDELPRQARLDGVGAADDAAALRAQVLGDEPPPGAPGLQLAVLGSELGDGRRAADAVAADRAVQRARVGAVLVEGEEVGLVDDAVAVDDRAGEDVVVAAGLRRRAGVQLGRERLGSELREDVPAEGHVRAEADAAGVVDRDRLPGVGDAVEPRG